jgi:dihydroorotate dehydrogenase
MMKFLYQNALKPLLFKFQPDLVHKLFIQIGKQVGAVPPLGFAVRAIYGKPQSKATVVDGITYAGPVLLAAGFDYNGYIADALYNVGFAGEEVGSVTAKPCKGNPPPNLKRLIKSQSIQVYKGLKNDGVEAIIARLKNNPPPSGFVQGISIAKTNSKECAAIDDAITDYCYSFRRLNEEKIGAFYTINISCPNAFGGEDFARADYLEKLIIALKEIPCEKPIYFKMPINKPWDEFKSLLDVIVKYQIHGVVIGNLNKNYDEVDFKEEFDNPNFRGGLSGKPCQKRSTQLIRQTREYCPDITIMGCGGILSVEEALEKLAAGANLLQLISGMIFNGPHLISEINRAYKDRT